MVGFVGIHRLVAAAVFFAVAVAILQFTPAGKAEPGAIEAPSDDGRTLFPEYRTEIRLALVTVPLLGAVFWWLRRLRGRSLVIERRTTREHPALVEVSLSEPEHDLYQGAGFARVRVEAQRRYTSGRGDLDADATVEKTVERLGFFSPVYRRRFELPIYLALVDRTGVRDQQARRVDELLDRFDKGGVEIERYDFNRDPRRVRSHRGAGAARSLAELAALYPHHRLLLFTDGAGLTQVGTRRLARWTEIFAAWPERALLTPVASRYWTRRELEAASAGFYVLPSTAAGVQAFVAWLQGSSGVGQNLVESWQPLPELIAERPGRWLERHPVDEDEVGELCRELRSYLGRDGYRWLCSLAVYPDLDWYLTLELGLKLRRHRNRDGIAPPHSPRGDGILDETTLIDLVRLPWLQHGTIPDWLRLYLIQELSARDEQDIRVLLYDLLEQRLEPAGSRYRFGVASRDEPESTKTRRDWHQLLRDLLRAEPPGSQLEDHLFVSFLFGKRPERLQLLAPSNWRRWIYERGLPSLGLHGATLLIGALALATAAWVGGDMALQVLGLGYALAGLYAAVKPLTPGLMRRRSTSGRSAAKSPRKFRKWLRWAPGLAIGAFLVLIIAGIISGLVPVSSVLLVLLGVTFLYVGGEMLIDNAIRLARRFNLSTMVTGLTVVAFGTSSPELAAVMVAVLGGEPDISVGAVFGSNFTNLALILGICALIVPFTVTTAFLRREVAFMIFATVLVYPLMANGLLNRLEGLVLLAMLVGFVYVLIRDPAAQDEHLVADSEALAKQPRPIWLSLLGVAVSVGLLGVGAYGLVKGATGVATSLGVSEMAIGFMVVALGSNLPGLAASLVALGRGEGDIVLGNLVGSNIFNLLCVLALSALVVPIHVASVAMRLDYWMMLGISLLLLIFLVSNRRLVRSEGAVLLVIYLAYVLYKISSA